MDRIVSNLGDPTFPRWVSVLSEAMDDNDPKGTILGQLGTICERGDGWKLNKRPTVRNVNIRRLSGTRLSFCTDVRSGKICDATAGNPYAELCVYLPKNKIQLRLSGIISVDRAGSLPQQLWNSLTPPERLWWAWPPPGTPLSPRAFNVSPPSDMPDTFCVATLTPDFVDECQFSEVPFRRFFHSCTQSLSHEPKWTIQPVNP